MTYYLLPNTSFLIHKNIDCIFTENLPEVKYSNSLSHYLYNIKTQIDYHEKDWDIYKKYTNPYEYIHTSVPYKRKSISKHNPLSRSFFKMVEMINTFNIRFDSSPIKTFHLAEGPGGFIEALAMDRENKDDVYIGMTLIDNNNDPNIPGWKKTTHFLNKYENVFIETGKDGTGNILSIDNFMYCNELYANSMDVITADGGFDFSLDFNKQEISISRLLYAQICFALIMQKKEGTFILKIFDCFMEHSVDLLYILSSFYDKVYLIKPQTSRYANSEKYVVCKGFLFDTNKHFFPFLLNAFEKMLSDEQNIKRFLNISVSYYFINKIEEYNAIFGQQQIENIHYTISLIENLYKQDKIDNLVKVNIQKCIQWCIKHNISREPTVPSDAPFSRELTVPSDAPFSREPTVPSDAPSLIDEELVFGISRIDDKLVFGDESSRIDEELVFGISRIDEELVFGNEPSLLHEYTIDSRI
jgi:23S rRNA U2552 (ribose-2'-O)-methylase RlmE/FtsJ